MTSITRGFLFDPVGDHIFSPPSDDRGISRIIPRDDSFQKPSTKADEDVSEKNSISQVEDCYRVENTAFKESLANVYM